MSPNFKQTHDSAAESKPFQHYHHSGICTNIQLWWQWSWWVLQGIPVSTWSNTKAGHSCCTSDWIAKVGEDAQEDWVKVCRPSCTPETNDRGLKLLDFATYNNLVLANTPGNHKPSRRWTWHSPDGTHHNQIDYILVKKWFRSDIKTARTSRTFPGADVGSDYDMLMMTFQTRLQNSRQPTQPRIRFDFEKLNDPRRMSAFQATIGGRFAPLAMLVDEDADLDSMVNKTVTDTAAEFLGKQRRKMKRWVTPWDPWSLWPKTRPKEKERWARRSQRLRLKERSVQRWRWQKRLGYRVNVRK